MAPLSTEPAAAANTDRRATRSLSKAENAEEKISKPKNHPETPGKRLLSPSVSSSSSRSTNSTVSASELSSLEKSPKKEFQLEKPSPAIAFKLVKNGVIHSPNQPIKDLPTQPHPKPQNQPIKPPPTALFKPTENNHSASSTSKNALSVNFIPVDSFSNGALGNGQKGATDGRDSRPTFIVQIGADGQDGVSGSAGAAVLPFNKGATTPTQCIFRLTAPAVTKKISGMQTHQNFTLDRFQPNGQSKVVFLPPYSTATASGATGSASQVITLTGAPDSKTKISDSTYSVSPPGKILKHPSGYAITTVKGKHAATVSPVKVPVIIPVSPVSVQPVVLPRQDVVPLLTTVPPDTDWADLVSAYEASGLNARCSKEKEKKLLKDFENIRCMYEDQQVLWKTLPKPEPLNIPDLAPSKVGDLLSVGRFIEVLQHVNKTVRNKKRRVDFDFILSAVTMPDGNAGKYLFLLNWMVWAFDDRKNAITGLKIPPEFGVTIQTVEVDHVLACETLRQYLVLLVERRKVCRASPEMTSLLKKLKTTDVVSLTVNERADLLAFAHAALLQHTDLFLSCINRMETDQFQAGAKRKAAVESIGVKLTDLRAKEAELRAFEERDKTTRTEERERSRLSDEIKFLSAEVDRLRAERKGAEEDSEKLGKMMFMTSHSEPLGYDRDFNRFWLFPELSDLVFVESGWNVAPPSSAAPPAPAPKILGNFIFLDRFSELYYLNDNGTHSKCSGKTLAPLPVQPNVWRTYTIEALPGVIQNLNQMGLREGMLKTRLNGVRAVKVNEAQLPKPPRPDPVIAESVFEIVSELFLKVTNDLIANQMLAGELDVDWESAVKSRDISRIRSQVLTVYRLVHPQLIRPDFFVSIHEKTWPESVLECSSMSRLYFLCKVLDLSVLWEKGTLKQACKTCAKCGRRTSMRRCADCFGVFHDKKECMEFAGKSCSGCARAVLPETLCTPAMPAMEAQECTTSNAAREGSQPSSRTGVKRKASLDGSSSIESSSAPSSVHSYKLRRKDRSVSTASK